MTTASRSQFDFRHKKSPGHIAEAFFIYHISRLASYSLQVFPFGCLCPTVLLPFYGSLCLCVTWPRMFKCSLVALLRLNSGSKIFLFSFRRNYSDNILSKRGQNVGQMTQKRYFALFFIFFHKTLGKSQE